MATDTKEKIILTGARIIHHKGFHHTGIQEILKEAGVPKGSFYFYFKNKDDFGLQVLDFFSSYFDSLATTILTDTTIPPLTRLATFFDTFNDFFKAKDYTLGCPIGNLAQEMGDLHRAFREKLDSAIDRMADHYIALLSEAQEQGAIAQDLNLRETAYFIVSSWQGALLRMKVTKSMEPLEIWRRFILERILKAD